MKQLLRILAGLAFTALPLSAATNTIRVYFIGNSVTDTVRYGDLAQLAAVRGVKLDWGRTMIPGAPLEWIYTHPNDGFQQEPYGTWTNALNHFAWDAVSLQPFDRQLHGKNQEGQDLGRRGLDQGVRTNGGANESGRADLPLCALAKGDQRRQGNAV